MPRSLLMSSVSQARRVSGSSAVLRRKGFLPSAERFEDRLLLNGDPILISLSPAAVDVLEGEMATFTARLSVATIEQVITVQYRTVAGTAQPGQDYVEILDGQLFFDFGETEKTFQVQTLSNAVYEGDESFSVELFNPAPVNTSISPSARQSTVTILDTPPQLSINDQTVNEGGVGLTDAVFTVSLLGATEVTAMVMYATADGTAKADVDYLPQTGQLTFAPGVTTQEIRVPIIGNYQIGTTRTFYVNLSSPTNATIARGQGVGTIIDEDTLVVTNLDDSGPGSLRDTILTANATPNADEITFKLAGDGPFTIQPLSALPVLTEAVVIDGFSQPKSAPNKGLVGEATNTVILVQIDGSRAGAAAGLVLSGGASQVRGLSITRFASAGIEIRGQGGNLIAGNFLGLTPSGQVTGNLGDGLGINGTRGNTIGGTSPAARNVISGNAGVGLRMTGSGANGNIVQGNFIGTDTAGTGAAGNAADGIFLDGASGNTIGGADAGARNLISGNRGSGVQVLSGSANVVLGNYIGTDRTGRAALGNGRDGVFLNQSSGNVVGLAGASVQAARAGVVSALAVSIQSGGNVISGNGLVGLRILGVTAAGNVAHANRIGTDIDGTSALGNTYDGVYLQDSPSNEIGGNGPGQGNLISGNGVVGLQIAGTTASGNVVRGNLIGTDIMGQAALGNGKNGVFINNAPANTIGGRTAGDRNVISGNGVVGLQLFEGNARDNRIEGNYIGTTLTGRPSLGNDYGIFLNAAPQNLLIGNRVLGNRTAQVYRETGEEGPIVTTATFDGVAISLKFNRSLDPTRAVNRAFYAVSQGAGSPVAIQVLSYDALRRIVTLTLAQRLPANSQLDLMVRSGGLTSNTGVAIDGDLNGRAGGDYRVGLSVASTTSMTGGSRRLPAQSTRKPLPRVPVALGTRPLPRRFPGLRFKSR